MMAEAKAKKKIPWWTKLGWDIPEEKVKFSRLQDYICQVVILAYKNFDGAQVGRSKIQNDVYYGGLYCNKRDKISQENANKTINRAILFLSLKGYIRVEKNKDKITGKDLISAEPKLMRWYRNLFRK